MNPQVSEWPPIQTAPLSVYPPHDEWQGPTGSTTAVLRAALEQAVQGVELGTYDKRIIEWLSGLDVPTVAVVVSLFHRVQDAEAVGSLRRIDGKLHRFTGKEWLPE